MGGTLARAAAAGHRVIVVTATDGAVGEVDEGFLDPGETLADRRARELQDAARILGIERAVQLGYRDSGMMGTDANTDPSCFWQADIDQAAAKLARILEEVTADVLVVYDSYGGYGHPDHIQVHRVGHAAARMADTAHVYEVSMHRDRIRERWERTAGEAGSRADDERYDLDRMGLADDEITTAVDVSEVLRTKRAAMAAHASQVAESGSLLGMEAVDFARAFGTEWFRRVRPDFDGDPIADRESWLAGL